MFNNNNDSATDDEDEDIPIKWLAPSFDRDSSPRWSPDGTEIVFIRRPGAAGKPDSFLGARHIPWKIVKAELNSSKSTEL